MDLLDHVANPIPLPFPTQTEITSNGEIVEKSTLHEDTRTANCGGGETHTIINKAEEHAGHQKQQDLIIIEKSTNSMDVDLPASHYELDGASFVDTIDVKSDTQDTSRSPIHDRKRGREAVTEPIIITTKRAKSNEDPKDPAVDGVGNDIATQGGSLLSSNDRELSKPMEIFQELLNDVENRLASTEEVIENYTVYTETIRNAARKYTEQQVDKIVKSTNSLDVDSKALDSDPDEVIFVDQIDMQTFAPVVSSMPMLARERGREACTEALDIPRADCDEDPGGPAVIAGPSGVDEKNNCCGSLLSSPNDRNVSHPIEIYLEELLHDVENKLASNEEPQNYQEDEIKKSTDLDADSQSLDSDPDEVIFVGQIDVQKIGPVVSKRKRSQEAGTATTNICGSLLPSPNDGNVLDQMEVSLNLLGDVEIKLASNEGPPRNHQEDKIEKSTNLLDMNSQSLDSDPDEVIFVDQTDPDEVIFVDQIDVQTIAPVVSRTPVLAKSPDGPAIIAGPSGADGKNNNWRSLLSSPNDRQVSKPKEIFLQQLDDAEEKLASKEEDSECTLNSDTIRDTAKKYTEPTNSLDVDLQTLDSDSDEVIFVDKINLHTIAPPVVSSTPVLARNRGREASTEALDIPTKTAECDKEPLGPTIIPSGVGEEYNKRSFLTQPKDGELLKPKKINLNDDANPNPSMKPCTTTLRKIASNIEIKEKWTLYKDTRPPKSGGSGTNNVIDLAKEDKDPQQQEGNTGKSTNSMDVDLQALKDDTDEVIFVNQTYGPASTAGPSRIAGKNTKWSSSLTYPKERRLGKQKQGLLDPLDDVAKPIPSMKPCIPDTKIPSNPEIMEKWTLYKDFSISTINAAKENMMVPKIYLEDKIGKSTNLVDVNLKVLKDNPDAVISVDQTDVKTVAPVNEEPLNIATKSAKSNEEPNHPAVNGVGDNLTTGCSPMTNPKARKLPEPLKIRYNLNLLTDLQKAFKRPLCDNFDPKNYSNQVFNDILLPYGSWEYNMVYDKFSARFYGCEITQIFKIQNPFISLHYQIAKSKFLTQNDGIEEEFYFHGTWQENVEGICRFNFDRSKIRKHKFGKGISFATDPSYAANYPNGCGRFNKVMVVAKMFYNNPLEYGYKRTVLPEGPSCTTKNEAGNVIVKYDDASYYPAYVIYYCDSRYY